MQSDIIWQPGVTLEEVEKAVIMRALHYHQNNKTQTAMALKIAIRTLDNKLAKYKAEAEQKKEN